MRLHLMLLCLALSACEQAEDTGSSPVFDDGQGNLTDNLSDQEKSAKIVGTWDCTVHHITLHPGLLSVDQQEAEVEYRNNGTLGAVSQISATEEGNSIDMTAVSKGKWKIENGKLVEQSVSIRLALLLINGQPFDDPSILKSVEGGFLSRNSVSTVMFNDDAMYISSEDVSVSCQGAS